MIDTRKYEDVLLYLGGQYFIKDIQLVPDIKSWASDKNSDLREPYYPMKLIARSGDTLTMVMQREISNEIINDIIKNLSVRWALRDTITDMDKKLNSTKKRLVYCYLKERARTMKDIGGDEQVEDQWVLEEMEDLDFFKE